MTVRRPRTTASYVGLAPASERASAAARGSSSKRDTACELLLRRALTRLGLRYRLDAADLVGRPDIVFRRERVAIFCDGDFWHGRDIEQRVSRLVAGHNAPYWVAKISGNVERDRKRTAQLTAEGWLVLRFWETEIRAAPDAVAAQVHAALRGRR